MEAQQKTPIWQGRYVNLLGYNMYNTHTKKG
jgi:hypothetical protein